MIEVLGLNRKFGGFSLQNIQLKVEKGSYTVILGPSGCGKSLLLSTLAGLHRPDQGKILIGGEDVTTFPPEKRRMGMVFQGSALFPHYNVENNIAFGLKVSGIAKQERKARVAEMIEVVGLLPILGRPVVSLSGGESQKVALARALVMRPKVLLLDEPLSHVDHNTRLELQDELKRIHRELRLTTLHVTHNREEAQALGDGCAVMLGGRLIQAGSLAEVRSSPTCQFVARFLGMNSASLPPAPKGCSEGCLLGSGACDRVGGGDNHSEL